MIQFFINLKDDDDIKLRLCRVSEYLNTRPKLSLTRFHFSGSNYPILLNKMCVGNGEA